MAVDPADITPSIAQVAENIRVRTRDVDGVELGTFNADTRPTATIVNETIAKSARYVARKLGTPGSQWDGDLEASATDVVAVHAALKIETSYYGDDEDSLADQLGRMFREELDSLVSTAKNNQVGRWPITSVLQEPAPVALDWEGTALLPEQIANAPEPDDEP